MSAELDTLARAWQGLLDTAAGIPDDRLSEPGTVGDWSVKDVLAHVAYWDGEDLDAIERHLAGIPDPEDVDWQAINERVAAERRDWTAADVRSDLLDTHARVLAALRSAPGFDRSRLKESWEHYDEHAAEIRVWRERVGV